MYQGIRTNLGIGMHQRLCMPRFPVTIAELERLLGITVTVAYGCQEASGALVGLQSTPVNLAVKGTPKYRQRVRGLAEIGAFADSGGEHGWVNSVAGEAGLVMPGASSFFWLAYNSWNGIAAAADFPLGILDANDGQEFIRIYDNLNAHIYSVREAVNSKTFTIDAGGIPAEKGAKARAMLYDVADGLVYKFATALEVGTSAMGAWTGFDGATCSAPFFGISSWPGVNGSGHTTRFALVAKGAQLDGKGPTLAALMRRMGWSF